MTGDATRWPLDGHADDLARLDVLTGGTVSATAVTGVSQLSLRVDPSVLGRLPVEAPSEPNTAITSDELDVLWLGPDEWLVVTSGDVPSVAAPIAAVLGDVHHALVDVGASRAILDLRGDRRRDLLASRCPLDLHPRSWHPGMCAQTLLGRAQVLLHERGDATRIFVRPSFAGYVVAVLLDAAVPEA